MNKGVFVTKRTEQRVWKMWAGFMDDKPDFDLYVGSNVVYGVVYPTRKLARERYQDVRRVEVREVARGRKRK